MLFKAHMLSHILSEPQNSPVKRAGQIFMPFFQEKKLEQKWRNGNGFPELLGVGLEFDPCWLLFCQVLLILRNSKHNSKNWGHITLSQTFPDLTCFLNKIHTSVGFESSQQKFLTTNLQIMTRLTDGLLRLLQTVCKLFLCIFSELPADSQRAHGITHPLGQSHTWVQTSSFFFSRRCRLLVKSHYFNYVSCFSMLHVY